jgi:hypothetical protein
MDALSAKTDFRIFVDEFESLAAVFGLTAFFHFACISNLMESFLR